MAPSLPPTEARVPMHSPRGANKRIADASIERVRGLAGAGAEELSGALRRLEREWDMERTLELNASIAAGVGVLLALEGRLGWLWFSAGVLAFLAQHALQGWCPPMPVFRWLGVRTAGEVQDEMNAVRALRGDFGAFSGGKPASAEALADSKRLTGTFLGARGAGTSAAKASAAAKEE